MDSFSNSIGNLNYEKNKKNDEIIHSIPKYWKDALIANSENIKNLIFQAQHITKNHQIYCLNKLNSKEIYTILTESGVSVSHSRLYYHSFFKIQILIEKLHMYYLL